MLEAPKVTAVTRFAILSDLIAALRSRRIAAKLVVQAQLVSVSCPS